MREELRLRHSKTSFCRSCLGPKTPTSACRTAMSPPRAPRYLALCPRQRPATARGQFPRSRTLQPPGSAPTAQRRSAVCPRPDSRGQVGEEEAKPRPEEARRAPVRRAESSCAKASLETCAHRADCASRGLTLISAHRTQRESVLEILGWRPYLCGQRPSLHAHLNLS
jgi:hypothetical protein